MLLSIAEQAVLTATRTLAVAREWSVSALHGGAGIPQHHLHHEGQLHHLVCIHTMLHTLVRPQGWRPHCEQGSYLAGADTQA